MSAGDKFSLVVHDRGASVGDRWEVRERPDPAVARLVRNERPRGLAERIGPPRAGCCGGDRYFTFHAARPGRTTIVLYNCFQGCRNARTLEESVTARWDVVVG